EDGIRDSSVTGVQTCALPILGVAERAVTLHAAGHLREHRVEEHGLEIGRGRLGFGLRFWRYFGQGVGEIEIGMRLGHGRGARHAQRNATAVGIDEGGGHYITSMSASMAPAALIACRMLIRSRGPMPRPLRPSTNCCSDTPSLTTANFLPSSVTPTLVRGEIGRAS